jgi:SulP family sulfate permease
MLVPQSLAYASLAGMPPLYGIFTAIAGLILYPIFGTSPQLAIGPTAMQSLLTAGALAAFDDASPCDNPEQVADAGCQRHIELALELSFLVGEFGRTATGTGTAIATDTP